MMYRILIASLAVGGIATTARALRGTTADRGSAHRTSTAHRWTSRRCRVDGRPVDRRFHATRAGGGRARKLADAHYRRDDRDVPRTVRVEWALLRPWRTPGGGQRHLRRYGMDGTTAARDAAGHLRVTDGAQSFTLANRDFTVRSLRSNLVTRWEWRPGSTLFLVWQQNRAASDPVGRLVRTRGLLDAFSATGDNYFAVKLSYWIAAR